MRIFQTFRYSLRLFIFSAVVLVLAVTAVWAEDGDAISHLRLGPTVCNGKVVPINSVPGSGVLYKSENIHGGRGPTFLVQNVSQRTNKQVIEVRNARCEVVGTLGLFKTDQPYGSRYYSRTGGSGQDGQQLLDTASLVGSTNVLIEGVNGTWIRVKNPTLREGNVAK